MCAPLAQCYCQLLRWTTNLCMVTNLKCSLCMIVSRDNTSSSITFFNSTLADIVTFSYTYLDACNSLGMHCFSTIKNHTLKLVALTYAFEALANAVGFLRTSDTITHSSNCAGDKWTSKVGTLCESTTLCYDSSKDMLCTFALGLS